MKIIHITASYKPAYIYGGPIQSVGKLCEKLAGLEVRNGELGSRKVGELESWEVEKLLQVEVFTTTANGNGELEVDTGKAILVDHVPITYFNRWTKDHSHFSPGLLWGLRKVLRKLKPALDQDSKYQQQPPRLAGTPPEEGNNLVIHIHAWWNLVSVLSCLVAKWYSIPVVLSPRGMLTSYSQHNRHYFAKKIMHRLIGKRLLKYCHIHATSELEKEDILKIIAPKSITVIANLLNFGYRLGISEYQGAKDSHQSEKHEKAESGKLKDQSEKQVSTFKLIFLSRIEEKKGMELLFDALTLFEINWSLTIAGSGEESYLENLKQKAERLKLNDSINWIGQVSNEDKYAILASHDLLVLPSYNENFANVVMESLSVGTAVLVSDQVGLSDYIAKTDLGWVSSLDTEDISAKMLSAFNDKLKQERIRKNAPSIIRDDFNDDVLVGQYLELYKTVLN